MYKNKRKHQYDQIKKQIKNNKILSKTKLSKKLGIIRTILDKIIKEYDKPSFFQYERTYSNNKISYEIRNKLFSNTINFLNKINSHRKEITFIPIFSILKSYIDREDFVCMRTYQNIIKENNFYLLSCDRFTKKLINKKIKNPRRKIFK